MPPIPAFFEQMHVFVEPAVFAKTHRLTRSCSFQASGSACLA